MPNETSNHLVAALSSLREEERRLVAEIKLSQERLHEIQAATSTINKLLNGASVQRMATQETTYANLTLRDAIVRIMKDRGVPLTAPEIAKSLKDKGYKSNAVNFTNMIGVTLRRLEGERFRREDKNWMPL